MSTRKQEQSEDSLDKHAEEVKIVVNVLQELWRSMRKKNHVEYHTPQSKSPHTIQQQHRHLSSSPPPPSVDTLAGLPLTILLALTPADSEIVIPPRALSHLHHSFRSSSRS
jgi:hypothetical protein